ncbi:MAG: hypothetical protein QM751_11455 [Paludibacteraceae bacterium]
MKRFNNFTLGLVLGLILPALFIWVYLAALYPVKISVTEIIKQLYPSVLLGKLLLLSIIPDLAMVFLFYKKDTFRMAGGIMLGAILYLIGAIFIM